MSMIGALRSEFSDTTRSYWTAVRTACQTKRGVVVGMSDKCAGWRRIGASGGVVSTVNARTTLQLPATPTSLIARTRQ